MDASIIDIQRILPHRSPFLFIDRVVNIVPGKSGTGIKNITANEKWLTGHNLTFPLSFFVEIMAQTCAMICAAAEADDNFGQGYLAGFDLECQHRVTVGDIINTHVSIIKIWGTLILAEGIISVNNKEIGKGRFTISLLEPVDL
jgi:3-hydroxyacyl-[acyl-carrier-protein] dehydratase